VQENHLEEDELCIALECMFFFDETGTALTAVDLSAACRMLGYEVSIEAAEASLALLEPEGKGRILHLPALCDALRSEVHSLEANHVLKQKEADKKTIQKTTVKAEALSGGGEARDLLCKVALGLRATWEWFDRKQRGMFNWQELQSIARMLRIPATETTLKSIVLGYEKKHGSMAGVPISAFVRFVSSTSSQDLLLLQQALRDAVANVDRHAVLAAQASEIAAQAEIQAEEAARGREELNLAALRCRKIATRSKYKSVTILDKASEAEEAAKQAGNRTKDMKIRAKELRLEAKIAKEAAEKAKTSADEAGLQQSKGTFQRALWVQIRQYRECFAIFDTDGDGEVSAVEINDFLIRCHGRRPSAYEIERLLRSIDKSGDGAIQFTEFATMITSNATSDALTTLQARIDDFRTWFSVFDLDGEGTIDEEELVTTMQGLGVSKTKEEFHEMVLQIDQVRRDSPVQPTWTAINYYHIWTGFLK